MTTIRALVVGIGQYEQGGNWNVPGPLEAACDVAGWLLGLPDVSLQLDLFVDAGAALEVGLERAAAGRRLSIHRQTSAQRLNRFVREELPEQVQPGTQLFFFWSGHGLISSTTNDRLFACGDYKEGRVDTFFNASNFGRLLRTGRYSAYAGQMLFADVCGVFRHELSVALERHDQRKTAQLVRYASIAGEAVKAPTAGGTFTRTLLAVLAATGGYPRDLAALDERLHQAGVRADPSAASPPAADDGDPTRPWLFESAWTLLDGLDVGTLYRRPYERTMADLGLPAAPDLRTALRELCALRDETGPVPHGLLQFMMRLAALPELSDPIAGWLACEARAQARSRREIERKLEMENGQRLLVIDVQIRPDTTEIVAFRPYLCCADASFDQALPFGERRCHGWDAFVAELQAVLAEVDRHHPLQDVQIQFVIDPPLLDRPFHRIQTRPGDIPIGQHTAVVLRDRDRLFSTNPRRREQWAAYADKLRGQAPSAMKWIRIDRVGGIPKEQGLCFAGFNLPHPAGGGASSSKEKQVLHRLLLCGTPFLYVRHQAPAAPGDWAATAQALAQLSGSVGNIEGFVDEFRDARVRGDEDAEQASLVWDDPSFNPFTNARWQQD